ncbi:MAG TPA: ribonuclease T2 [Bryobacteraceae bacterium]|jgi:ribonuclease T2|nr:ribonuclease T2 [Bryobacteraceae bacterium]
MSTMWKLLITGLAIAGATAVLAAPAQFDYYVLSLSWAPEFCTQPGAAAANGAECATGKDVGFVVHGLWPQNNAGKSPESCGPAGRLSKAVIDFILPYMPNAGLIQHEWATHGTCTGLTPSNYFANVLQVRSAVQFPVQFTAAQEKAMESPGLIESQFARSNPSFPDGAFRSACRNGALTEVRVCFNKDLSPRACTASAGECTTSSIAILPPR